MYSRSPHIFYPLLTLTEEQFCHECTIRTRLHPIPAGDPLHISLRAGTASETRHYLSESRLRRSHPGTASSAMYSPRSTGELRVMANNHKALVDELHRLENEQREGKNRKTSLAQTKAKLARSSKDFGVHWSPLWR